MALKTFVKINSVNNLSDARYCAGMHVNVIGFKAGDSANSVNPEQFKEITSWISGVDYCLEFENEIDDSVNNYEAHYLQCNNLEELLKYEGQKKLIYSTSLKTINKKISSQIDFILLNEIDLSNEQELTILNEIAQEHPVLLGSSFDDTNINELIDSTNIKGIAITAGDEIRPGYKDYDEMADILEAIEIDEWV